MGRPRGLRKINGKWVRTEPEPQGTEGQDRKSYTDTQDRESYVPSVKLKEPVYVAPTKESKHVPDDKFQRNELVKTYNGQAWESGLVLGYLRGRVVVQLLEVGSPRVLANEDLVRPNPSKEE